MPSRPAHRPACHHRSVENEQRLRTPELLAEYGVHRAMNLILQGEGRPSGVLCVDRRSKHEFSPHDIAFLQGAANLGDLARALRVERQDCACASRRAAQEITHRVNNSLAIVAGMLKLQAGEVKIRL
jgi:two-component sensor histidine kinase